MSRLQFVQKATNLAYQLSGRAVKYAAVKSELAGSSQDIGWEVLRNSSQDNNTNQYNYKAVAFVNHKTKEVHITAAGTKPAEKYDLLDDALVAFACVPYKIEQVKAMVGNVIELLGGQDAARKYTFSTSGHSLGAVMSDLTLVEVISRGLPYDKSETFDNPGTADIVKRAIESNHFTNKVEVSIDELARHCEVYNAKPNFINSTNTQLGNTKLVLPKKVTDKVTVQDTSESSGVWGFASYLSNKVGAVVKACSDYLGITSVIKQIQSHSLSNFADLTSATVVETENWKKKVDGKLVINKLPLTNIDSTGEDVVAFSEEDIPGTSMIKIDSYCYAYDDLIRADNYARNCTLKYDSELIGDTMHIVY
jgi:hypothetical protein